MRIDVVQQRPLRHQTQRNREAAREGLDQTTVTSRQPAWQNVLDPALAAGPLERRRNGLSGLAFRLDLLIFSAAPLTMRPIYHAGSDVVGQPSGKLEVRSQR